MKLSNLFYLGALSALVLTGCKDNDDNSEWMTDGVVFTSHIEGMVSRASGSAWSDGDKVGIYMNAGGTDFENYEYTASADGALTAAKQTLKYPEEGTADFFAYYPYQSGISGKTYAVDVTDQSDPTKIDLLYATKTGISNGEAVNFAFSHQLSQIVINVSHDKTIASLNGLKIQVKGMNTQASFALADGTLTPTDSKADFDMNVNAEGTTAEAIVIPTADLTGAELVFTLADGKSFGWDLTQSDVSSFDKGTKYTYEASLSMTNGQPSADMGNATIDNWTDQAGGNINVDFGEGTQTGGEVVVLDEPFADGPGDFTIEDKNLGELTSVWNNDDRYSCMKASAYTNETNHAAESWLVSPEIDLTSATTATLSFEHAINFNNQGAMSDNHIVAVSTDNGSNWTPLSDVTYPEDNSWTFIPSGNIDLSTYAGQKIKIAFQYKSSSASASTWEVKNVKVVANGGSGTVDPNPDPEPEPTPGEDVYTSNIELPESTSTSAVQTNAYGGIVKINGNEYPVLKLGTGSKAGNWTSPTLSADATSLSFYAVAWNNKTCQLTITINGGTFDDDQASKTIELTANTGANNNSPYTITPSSSDYKTFTLKNITSSSTITFSTGEDSGNARAILFGINVK